LLNKSFFAHPQSAPELDELLETLSLEELLELLLSLLLLLDELFLPKIELNNAFVQLEEAPLELDEELDELLELLSPSQSQLSSSLDASA